MDIFYPHGESPIRFTIRILLDFQIVEAKEFNNLFRHNTCLYKKQFREDKNSFGTKLALGLFKRAGKHKSENKTERFTLVLIKILP